MSMSKAPAGKRAVVSKGQKQRVLEVMIDNSSVYVRDKAADSFAVSSDNYAMTNFNSLNGVHVMEPEAEAARLTT